VSSGVRVAYFSMEIAIDTRMPTYAGGLGVLAGDMLRSCADLEVPVVAVTLLWRKGYFHQTLDARGNQSEAAAEWEPERFLTELPLRVTVEIEGRKVGLRVFERQMIGTSGYVVPVLLLDTDVDGNAPEDRRLADALYGGDERHRLAQEIVLGIGGVRALDALGYAPRMLHLNEGHAALAAVELVRELHKEGEPWPIDEARKRCVFTTHTPVPAAHDQFDWDLAMRMLGETLPRDVFESLAGHEKMNMTQLASSLSHYVNGVARRQAELADIRHITNGVHSASWTSEPFRELFDRHVPEWREDPAMLRKAISIPAPQIWDAHVAAKDALLAVVRDRTGRTLRRDALTLGFARRATAYKRTDLIFEDTERLRAIGKQWDLQLVFAGKAHPNDAEGKALIRHVFEASRALADDVTVVYLPNYEVDLARVLVAGVDVWLNTPLPPLEASGTSGMKAAHNGVPSLSVLDGWWLEGCVDGITGWAVGGPGGVDDGSRALYVKLDEVVAPMFYEDRARFITVMQHAIALNASFFNTHRMVQQYVTNAYMP
jgi:starch phosphorylase